MAYLGQVCSLNERTQDTRNLLVHQHFFVRRRTNVSQVKEILEIIGILLRGTNTFQLGVGYVDYFTAKGYCCFLFKVDIGLGKERFS